MEVVSLEHLRQLAYAAYANISMYPEKKATDTIKEFGEELNTDLQHIRMAASSDTNSATLEAALLRYHKRYEYHLTDWLHSSTRLASFFIVGPSNFPAARMQKRRGWTDNKYAYFREWRQRALKAISKSLKPKVNELEEARQKLKNREEMQQLMISDNKILRKGGLEVSGKLKALGLADDTIIKLQTPDWVKRTGFKYFELTNNNAEIRRLRTRVTLVEAKDKLSRTQGKRTEEINRIKVVHNYETDRVQLFFNGKPDENTISRLKSNGFHWTPSQRAWQRKLTEQAVNAVQHVLKKKRI